VADAQKFRLEVLRFLRQTALRMQELAQEVPIPIGAELTRLALDIDKEAADIEMLVLNGDVTNRDARFGG
jgi:hypothetical protein